jgi:hypothetical protein
MENNSRNFNLMTDNEHLDTTEVLKKSHQNLIISHLNPIRHMNTVDMDENF